jgi:hypothetical protein
MTTIIAAFLLRLSGASVEYRVQRIKPKPTIVADANEPLRTHTTDGITVLRTPSYFEARRRFRATRAAPTDTITVRVVATVKQRHGKVDAT